MNATTIDIYIPKKPLEKDEVREIILCQIVEQVRLDLLFIMFDEFVSEDCLGLENKVNLTEIDRFELFRASIDFKTVEFLAKIDDEVFNMLETVVKMPPSFIMKMFKSDHVKIEKDFDMDNPDLATLLIAALVVRRSRYKSPIEFMDSFNADNISFDYGGEFDLYVKFDNDIEKRVLH